MSEVVHKAYIISDLHLGGVSPSEKDRGFRMMKDTDVLGAFIEELVRKPPTDPSIELVINGDSIDFLAERYGPGEWKAFRDEPGEAVTIFAEIAKRKDDGKVFDALGELLGAGHRLTMLIGNHDIELTWPEVRSAFEERLRRVSALRSRAFNLRWVHDGEALVIGDCLIEHGNRYDPTNFVDHERLRRLRELRSRRLYDLEADIFFPPVGSRLVAEVMNPVKQEFPFIDLLKPESEPLFALLLALDPGKRKLLAELALTLRRIPIEFFGDAADPGWRQKISGAADGSGVMHARDSGGADHDGDEALQEIIGRMVPDDEVVDSTMGSDPAPVMDISMQKISGGVADKAASWLSLVRLLFASDDSKIQKRLPMLRLALRALKGDQTFDAKVETGKRYLAAAKRLAAGSGYSNASNAPDGFRFVVFGHTHHQKRVPLDNGATYINTGTWARLMRFPEELLDPDDAVAMKALKAFVASIKDHSYETEFVPSYARVDLRGDGLVNDVALNTFVVGEGVA